MAQPINENDVMEIVIEGTNEGMPWAIVRHYLATAVTNPDSWLANLADHWQTTILGSVDNFLTDQWQAECLSISRVAPQPRNVFFRNFAAPVVGDVTTDGVANQTAALIRLTTDEVGPRNRGRLYLCGIPEAATNGGLLTAAAIADLQTNFADLLFEAVTVAGDTATPCIFSRTAYNPAADPPQAASVYSSALTGAEVIGNLATQRRRRYSRNATG